MFGRNNMLHCFITNIGFPIGQRYDVVLETTSLSKESNLTNYFTKFDDKDVEETTEMVKSSFRLAIILNSIIPNYSSMTSLQQRW
jgi:hypothetical protein